MTKLKVTQVRSVIHRPKDQKQTVRRLGLHRIRDSVIKDDRPEIRGMIAKVQHLVRVEEVPGDGRRHEGGSKAPEPRKDVVVKLHHLKPAEGAKKDRTRVGRGRAGTRGKTAGRGTKGWGARHNPKPGFEGGQMPLQRRVPKLKGFTNPNRVEYAVVNVGSLGEVFEGEVDPKALLEHGLVRKGRPVKILARGEIDKALTVRAHAFSEAAKAKIEGAGGRAEVLGDQG